MAGTKLSQPVGVGVDQPGKRSFGDEVPQKSPSRHRSHCPEGGALQICRLGPSPRRAPDHVQSRRALFCFTDPFLPTHTPSLGCATSKWCSASWRCRCLPVGGFWGSARAGEGAGLRKSLRVPSRRKRSRWGSGRPPWDHGASPGDTAPALWMPLSCPQLGPPAPGWIQAAPSGFPGWDRRQQREGLFGRWSRRLARRGPFLQFGRVRSPQGTPALPVPRQGSSPHPSSGSRNSWGSRGCPPAGRNVPRPGARRSPGSRSGSHASDVPPLLCSAERRSAGHRRGSAAAATRRDDGRSRDVHRGRSI